MQMKPISRNMRIWIILICLFLTSCFSYQGVTSANGTPEKITQNVEIYYPRTNQTSYEIITLYLWKPHIISNDPLPVVILVNGDAESATALTYPRNALLDQGYCVAIVEIAYFSRTTFHKLNASLNYLLNRTDLDPTKISIMGHSHGGHYALFFSTMRNESIQAVVVANFGSVEILWNDYYEYYSEFVELNATLTEELFLLNRTKPFNLNSPRNLLFLTDTWDDRPDHPLEQYLDIVSSNQFNETGRLYGSFENGTAVQLKINRGIFGHGAFLFDPNAIITAIEWINNAQNQETLSEVHSTIWIDSIIGWILIIIIAITGFCIAAKTMMLIPKQNLLIEWIRWKIFSLFKRNKAIMTKSAQDAINSHYTAPILKTTAQDQQVKEPNVIPLRIYDLKQQKQFWCAMLQSLLGLFALNLLISLLNLEYYIWNFLDLISTIIGIYSGPIFFLISNYYPFSYLFFWFPVFYWIIRKVFPEEPISNIFNLPVKTILLKGIVAIEYFIPLFIIYRIMFWILLGDIIFGIYMSNILLGMGFLLLLNYFLLEIQPKMVESLKHSKMRSLIIQIGLFGIFALPSLLKITLYGIWINSARDNLIILSVIMIWNLCFNSRIYNRFRKDLLTLTFFEYILLGLF